MRRNIAAVALAGFALFAVPLVSAQPSTPAIEYATLTEPDDRLESAAQPFLDQLRADPNDQNAKRQLLDVYVRYGAWEPGLALAQTLAAGAQGDIDLLQAQVSLSTSRIGAASIFGMSKAADELLAICDAAYAQDPANPVALRCIAQFHLQAPSIVGGDKAKAEAAITSLATIDKPTHHLLRAYQAMGDENKPKALEHLAQALAAGPSADVALEVAVARSNLEDLPGAFAALQLAQDQMPEKPMILYNQGRLSAMAGQELENGRDSLLRFLTGSAWISGTDFRPGAHWRLGMIFEGLGDKQQAGRAYRKVLALDPKHKQAKAALKRLS